MTELTKPVSRRVSLILDNRLNARDRDRITVTLYPDGDIGFRPNHCRKEVRLALSTAYKLAVVQKAKEDEKQRQLKAKLEGRRVRKPKRSLLYS
jgi:hypothetical protein